MHRSSPSIASLAAALAKAQCELMNPEKSLVGSIKGKANEPAERLFRYASLADGLEIVRKTLGQHEIATVQTTAIDQTAGTVNLTTVLAHGSGEWIASDWPVCAVADTTEPHRMGAALTYARRYALFTLVGIAGADDLDAPDLIAPAGQTSGNWGGKGTNRRGNGFADAGYRSGQPDYKFNVPKPLLEPHQSGAQRDQLLAELESLGSSDAVTAWAQRVLVVKNSLMATDAQRIEDAFRAKLAALKGDEIAATDVPSTATQRDPSSRNSRRIVPGTPPKAETGDGQENLDPYSGQEVAVQTETAPSASTAAGIPQVIQNGRPIAPTRRRRDKAHLRLVATRACLVCGRRPVDPHHLRFAQQRALGRKVSDEFTVPLCRSHHRALHRSGDEPAWWAALKIDPLAVAHSLWKETRLLRKRETCKPKANGDHQSAAPPSPDQAPA